MALPGRSRDVPPIIEAAELAERIRSGRPPRIIDVREPGEFAEGHIPGAVNLPLSRFTQEFQALRPDEELALVCRSGNRSDMARRFLVSQGYTRARDFIDGMIGWFGPTRTP